MSNPYSSYLSKIRASESSGNDLAHNQYGASGRYQFLPSTWKGMGYNLKDIYNTQLQEEAVLRLTTDNSNYLKKRLGINPTDADLYGAHFLGPAGYAHLYQTADNAPISDVMSAKAINNNPHVKGKTVGFLKNWLAKKMSIKPSASESYASTSEGQDYGYGVDTSINLPTNTGEYQTAPDMAGTSTKEDAEADQAKAALLEKQKEKDFLAEVKARQEQTTELRQQQEQQQDNGLDPSYYQAPQVELPNYEAIKYQQAQNQAQAPQDKFQLGGKKYSEQNGRLVVTTKIVNTPNGPRFYQAKSPDYNFSIELADAKKVGDSIPRANLDPHIIEALNRRQDGGEIDLQYKDGGSIPQRYKNMGFTHVGQKKAGDGQKKWKVLAKKGDKYKVVQGGYRGMKDFSQHGSKKRQDNFWSRMGGRDSAKANDPFSPLYWHKRLGKWEDGGEIEGEVECTNCGWSWDKSESTEKDMYNCHKCGGKNTGRSVMKNGGQTDDDREMVNGIADILSQVDNQQNRAEIAKQMVKDFKNQDVVFDYEKFMEMSKLQNGGELLSQFQQGGEKEVKSALGAGKFNTTTGNTVVWGTPEYEAAYNRGEVVTDKGGRSEATLEGGQLDEVVVKGKKRGFWKQSRDKYLKEHQDDGLLGAIGSVATYPLAVGQHALTYATEGKVQDPSEAWGYNTNERWLDSPGAFGRNLADASLNIVADPSNLVGAGIVTKGKGVINALTKGKALSKGIVSYGDDLIQASKIAGKPKLPTYNNAYRWQADVVPESLVNAGKSLTAEQQALTGSWYTHDPNQLPFYMRTRPGSGNVNVSRLSDAKIANLESNMSDAARGMSGKTESVVASNTSLPGELILPKSLKDKVKQFKFDVNPSEYPLPSEQQELLKDPSFIGSPYHRLILQENTSNIINPILEAQYQPIMGVPRKYFPFKEGGEAVEQFQVGGYSLTPNIPSFDELFEDNTIYKGAPLEEVVIKAPRKKEIVNEKPFSINFDEETLRETQAVRDNIPNKRDLNIGITRYSDQATEDEYIKNQVIASNKLQEQEAAKKAKEFNDFSKELSSKGTLADAVENNEIPLDISSYKTEKDVTNLQKMLKEKGYNLNPKGKFANDGIDGKIGKVTFDAMVNYNKHNSESGYASIKEGTGLIGSCQESQCSEYMQNELFRNVQPKISREDWNKKTGLYGNAWNIGKNIVDSGGSKIQINKVKPGDVITMYTGGISDYQGEANAAGTGTTHTGLVDKINPDGSYYILHNVHDKNYATGDYTGVEYRDLVKDGKIVSGGLMRSFDVKYAFRPDYKEVKLGEKKILNDNIKLTLDPKKAAVLSSEEYDNSFTSANAKNKLLNTFIKPLNDSRNKKVISKVFGLGDDEYQSLAKVTLGVLGQETGFGTNAKYTTGAKEIAASVSKAAGYVPALALANEVLKSTTDTSFIKKDETSKGAGRLKYETNFGSDDLTELGVTEDNFDDEDKAPLTTMYKLATDYKRFLKKGYNKKDAMYRAITVYNVSLGHVSGGKTTEDWAKNYDVDYTNKVLNYSNFFNIGDNKKQYKTTTDELLLHPNVYKWRAKLKKEKKL